MTEFVLFLAAGIIAVVFAAYMLLSDNAVYSALSLIMVMASIAFMFLLLDAPFLAMIQITVYAGAIMVLFIFVIMLLGAERTGPRHPVFRWLTPVAVALATIFLLVAGIGLINGKINAQERVPAPPMLRVVNEASDAGLVDVYANDSLVAANLNFNEASDFVSLAPGEYTIAFTPENGDPITGTFTFGPDTAQALVAYGLENDITLSVVPLDLSAPDATSARVVFFNANPQAETVALADLGSNGQVDRDAGGNLTDRILIDSIEPGAVSDPIEFEGGTVRWAFIEPDGDIVSRVVGGETGRDYELERGTSQLVVLAADRSIIDNSVAPDSIVFSDEAGASFGGPEAIGEDLLTRYLLPFELVSLLLLAAMVGAIILTHKEDVRVRDRAALRRRVSRPLASVIAEQVGHEVTDRPQDTPALPAETTPAGD